MPTLYLHFCQEGTSTMYAAFVLGILTPNGSTPITSCSHGTAKSYSLLPSELSSNGTRGILVLSIFAFPPVYCHCGFHALFGLSPSSSNQSMDQNGPSKSSPTSSWAFSNMAMLLLARTMNFSAAFCLALLSPAWSAQGLSSPLVVTSGMLPKALLISLTDKLVPETVRDSLPVTA